jgi:hypothetical protein
MASAELDTSGNIRGGANLPSARERRLSRAIIHADRAARLTAGLPDTDVFTRLVESRQ